METKDRIAVLRSLLVRLECSPGPSRYLDAAILEYADVTALEKIWVEFGGIAEELPDSSGPSEFLLRCSPAYTESTDAALNFFERTLPNHSLTLSRDSDSEFIGQLYTPNGFWIAATKGWVCGHTHKARLKNKAIAICAATIIAEINRLEIDLRNTEECRDGATAPQDL